LVYGLIIAMVFHGAYDFFLFTEYKLGLGIGAIVSLYYGIRQSMKAMNQHNNQPRMAERDVAPNEWDNSADL